MVVRKRLIYWLVRAYIVKWRKTIFISFVSGLLVFFIILFSSKYFADIIPIYQHTITGVRGAYTVDNIPDFIVEKVSRGLTSVDNKGDIKPAIAEKWEILDKGKTYVFHIKKNQFFSDGRPITSDLINYNFADVIVDRPDKYTLIYKLKDTYAPFLVTVSRPIFQSGLVGSGEYKIDELNLNGNFIQTLTIVNTKNKFDLKTYEFYPSIEALKYAYVLGDVTQIVGLDNVSFNGKNYDTFANTTILKKVNYDRLVTLFYNNNDSMLSNKKLRLALSYALPTKFIEGEYAFLPYPSESIYYDRDLESKSQNFEHAKLLVDAVNTASDSAKSIKTKLSLKTMSKYKSAANDIAKNFSNIGVDTSIEEVDKVPSDFQIYLGDFVLSRDPDQYPLWHSDQLKNITKYKNLRIDKLLEDGRKTIDVDERKKIYDDFQKFLTEDVPASFLFFPIEYEVSRK